MRLTKQTVLIKLLLFGGIFLLLNVLVYRHYFRLDFTADKRYTLSKTTKDILKELEDPVTITAYFSDKLPSQVASIERDFKDILIEYQSSSNRNVVFEFINPNETEELEQEVQGLGIQPVLLQVRERDKSEQIRAYLGAIVKKGSQQEVLPFIQPGAAMEYALSTAIKRLTIENKNKVGFIMGHGEPPLQALSQSVAELSTLYDVDTVRMDDENSWANFKTLVLMAPTDSLTFVERANLDKFLGSGGGLLVGVNAVGISGGGNPQSPPFLMSTNTGIEAWLGEKGFTITPTFLIDVRCGSVQIPQQTPFGVLQVSREFPYFPLIASYEEHPVTQGLEAVPMSFVSPVEVAPRDSSVEAGTLAYTSEKSGKVPAPSMLDIDKEWTESDFPEGPQPVAAYMKGKIVGDVESKMIVVGDGDFPVQQGQQGANANNVNFLVNAVDWLTDDTGLIELRTRGVDNRLIDKQLSDGEKLTMKNVMFFLPILLVILYSLFRMQIRRSQKVRWMQEDYS